MKNELERTKISLNELWKEFEELRAFVVKFNYKFSIFEQQVRSKLNLSD